MSGGMPAYDDTYEIDEDPAYVAWAEAQMARGELAFAPETMECYPCGREHLLVQTDRFGLKFVPRTVVALGPIAEAHRDPTQTYVLECGHTAI
jgi:hypothetical protein